MSTTTQAATYDFLAIEKKWQQYWAAARDLPRSRTRASRASTQPSPSSTCWTCSRTPAARACTSATRRATPPRTSSPLQADAGLQRAAPDGLRRLRPAGGAVRRRARRPSADHDRAEHRQHRAADQDARLLVRLVAASRHHRPGLLPLDAVDLPEAVQRLVRPDRPGRARPIARSAALRKLVGELASVRAVEAHMPSHTQAGRDGCQRTASLGRPDARSSGRSSTIIAWRTSTRCR